MKNLIGFLLLVAIFLSCFDKKALPTQVDDSFIRNPFMFDIELHYGYDFPELGKAQSIKETVNERPSDKEEFKYVKVLQFDGVKIIVQTNDVNEICYDIITITNANIALKNGLKVGMKKEDIESLLGKSKYEDRNRISYSSKNEWCWLNFDIDKNKVEKIVWMNSL